jgi:hypothetical protein
VPAASDTVTKIQAQLEQQKTFAFETGSASRVDDAGKPVLGELPQAKGTVQKTPAASTLDTTLQANGENLGDSQAMTFVNGKAYATRRRPALG